MGSEATEGRRGRSDSGTASFRGSRGGGWWSEVEEDCAEGRLSESFFMFRARFACRGGGNWKEAESSVAEVSAEVSAGSSPETMTRAEESRAGVSM